MLGGIARTAAAFALVCAVVASAPALADDARRTAQLASQLASSSEKTRLAAVVALAKLGDRDAMKPLVGALADRSAKVRAIAAVALGKVGHKAALPALRTAAAADTDDDVRRRARAAAIAVASANQLPHPFAATIDTRAAVLRPKAGFGNQPHETRPELYLMIKSAADDSPGRADKQTRKHHAEIARRVLADECKASLAVTSAAADAKRYGLELRNIDLSVVKVEVAQAGALVEVEAQLRLAISDDKGKLLSFLSGGAKVQVPRRTYDVRYLPALRKEALENAVRGMFENLIAHLRDRARV